MEKINAEEIKASHNIIDIISQVVDLKKQGSDYFGCCPFHSEKTPSFSVSEKEQFFHCFGCGASGDVIKFVMDHQGLDFIEAVKSLGYDAALNPNASSINRDKAIQRKVVLPLDFYQKPIDINRISSFFNKCEVFENPTGEESIYFYDGCQAALLTDIYKNPVSIVLVKQGFRPRFFDKKFLYGSCAMFGQIEGDVYLCENWFTANKLNRVEGKNTICFFMPHNINFIYSAIKHKKIKMHAVCETDEAKFQAERLIVETAEI